MAAYDGGVITREAQRVVGNGDTEVLGDLAAAEQGADGSADPVGAAQRPPLAQNAGLNALEALLGGVEQLVSLAPALFGQGGVPADDQALAREVRAFDLGEVTVVKQRELERPALGRELLDRWRPQRGDPVEPGRLEVLFNASLRDHPAIADHDHAFETKAFLELGDLIAERRRIAGIAFEYLDCNRTTLGRAQKSEDDLHLVAPAVARVAEARQLAAATFDMARAHVVEHQHAVAQMPARQRRFDRRLSSA